MKPKLSKDEYCKSIRRMMKRREEWLAAHPKQTVQMVRPVGLVMFVGISSALGLGVITLNKPALELVKYMCLPEPVEPTTNTVVLVFENAVPPCFLDEGK